MIACTMGCPSSFNFKCWKVCLCLFGKLCMNSSHVTGSCIWVVVCPKPIVGVRYVAAVLIVMHLQLVGNDCVSPLPWVLYFGFQFECPQWQSWICHRPVQWYNFWVENEVSQCQQWIDLLGNCNHSPSCWSRWRRWFTRKAWCSANCHNVQSFFGGHPWFGQWNPVVNILFGLLAHISGSIYTPDPSHMSASIVTCKYILHRLTLDSLAPFRPACSKLWIKNRSLVLNMLRDGRSVSIQIVCWCWNCHTILIQELVARLCIALKSWVNRLFGLPSSKVIVSRLPRMSLPLRLLGLCPYCSIMSRCCIPCLVYMSVKFKP